MLKLWQNSCRMCNDVQALIQAFSKVKDIQHPIVVHINTLKGKGYERAEQDKETYHWRTPFNPETGEDVYKRQCQHSKNCYYIVSHIYSIKTYFFRYSIPLLHKNLQNM